MEELVSMASLKGFRTIHTNCSLARLVLNYKSIPYTTEWIDLVDIPTRLESHGVQPKPPESSGAAKGAQYTLPTVKIDKTFIMDSVNIVAQLESQYPESSLHLDTGLHQQAQAIVFQAALPLFSEFMPRIRDRLITEHSLPYWTKSRESLFGMSIDEFTRTKGGTKAWEAAEPGLQALSRFLSDHKRDSGPFILGSQVSYGDLILAAFLESTRRTSEDMFKRITDFHESIQLLYAACSKWLERSSY